jgi:peptidyl-prolyl cis-trans isomerase A (cyclophilin A)
MRRFLGIIIGIQWLFVNAAQGQLYADFRTTSGDFTVELHYDQTPVTVANFVSLAEGSRAFVDSRSGTVRKGRFYDGIRVHRTETAPSFRLLQAGSPKGDGSDGPGYEIRDEIRPNFRHEPYVISMAHSGPNTNGSQFFVTGNASLTGLDGLHTVFGAVANEASRTVVDAIIDAGANQTVIESVAIRREGEDAAGFDAQAQGLPEVRPSVGNLSVTANGPIFWNVTEPFTGLPASSVYALHFSQDLQGWNYYGRLYRSQDNNTPLLSINLGNATVPRLFFQMSEVQYFPAYAPSSLANRTCLVGLSHGVLTFQFSADGATGTAHFIDDVTSTETSTTFSVLMNLTRINPYSLSFAVSAIPSSVYGVSLPYQVKCGCDSSTAIQVDGHFQSFYFFNGWQQDALGIMTISR